MADQWWYPGTGLDESSFTSGPTTSGFAPQTYIYGTSIAIGVDGTATKLSVRAERNINGTAVLKLGLYNSSGDLVAQVGSIANDSLTAGWLEGTIDAAVTSGTYYVLASSSNSNSEYYYESTASNTGMGETVAYASAMPSTVNTTQDEAYRFAVRVYVVDANYQHAYPSADVTDGSWLSNTGTATDLYSFMDETSADDTDFIETGLSTTGVWSMTPITSVGAGTYIFKYRASGDASANLVAYVGVGTAAGTFSAVGSWTEVAVATALATFSHTVTGTFSDTTKFQFKLEST